MSWPAEPHCGGRIDTIFAPASGFVKLPKEFPRIRSAKRAVDLVWGRGIRIFSPYEVPKNEPRIEWSTSCAAGRGDCRAEGSIGTGAGSNCPSGTTVGRGVQRLLDFLQADVEAPRKVPSIPIVARGGYIDRLRRPGVVTATRFKACFIRRSETPAGGHGFQLEIPVAGRGARRPPASPNGGFGSHPRGLPYLWGSKSPIGEDGSRRSEWRRRWPVSPIGDSGSD